MDIQVCRMRAESYGYNLNDVVFAWTVKEQIDMAENLTLPQFSIMGHRYISCTKVQISSSFFISKKIIFSNIRRAITPVLKRNSYSNVKLAIT